jgi:hypothetical protein
MGQRGSVRCVLECVGTHLLVDATASPSPPALLTLALMRPSASGVSGMGTDARIWFAESRSSWAMCARVCVYAFAPQPYPGR